MKCPTIFWKIYKFFIHLFTGKSEIERICYDEEINGLVRNQRILESLRNSTKLSDIYLKIKSDEFDPEQIANSIAERKQFNQNILAYDSKVLPNLISSLEPISLIQTLKKSLKKLQVEAFNTENEEHERYLEELWSNLKPGIKRSGRHTSEWGEIGFQGKDPVTDLRGMGMLGLLSLHYFSREHPERARDVLANSNTQSVYPFSCTGINITSVLLTLLDKGHLTNHFSQSAATLEQFHELYVRFFILFDEFYQSKSPADLMAFNAILKEFTTQMTTQLTSPDYRPFN